MQKDQLESMISRNIFRNQINWLKGFITIQFQG